jgi:hypothetical protein
MAGTAANLRAAEAEPLVADSAAALPLDLRPLLTDFFPAAPDPETAAYDPMPAGQTGAPNYTMVPVPPAGVGFAITTAGFAGLRLVQALRRRGRRR